MRRELVTHQGCIVEGVDLVSERLWQCPSCGMGRVTREARPHTPFHRCVALAGLTAPFVEAGVRAVHRRVEREDYVAGELVQCDAAGRPVMAVVPETEDRQDCTVFAQPATAQARGGN